jgi:hypothetical protein
VYITCFADCAACRRTFSFNAQRVPALVINGQRAPICRSCAERWNALHPDRARPILPGAYEPQAAGEDDPWAE